MPDSTNALKRVWQRFVDPPGKGRPPFQTLLLAVGIAAFGLALSLYAYLGTFSRYYADDYCTTGGFLAGGFWNSQISSYVSWSPRFSGPFLINLSEFLGRWSISIWSALVILLWVAALTWTILQAGRAARLTLSAWLALLLAEALVFFTILEAPQQYQSIYWRIGIVTYTLPLALLSLLPGLIMNRLQKASTGRLPWGGAVACLLVAFVAGGFSETFVTLQTALLALALIGVWLGMRGPQRGAGRLLAAAALAGSLLALIVVVAAPGNAVRLGTMPARPSLFAFVRMTVTNAFLFVYISMKNNAFPDLLALLAPMLVTYVLYARGNGLPKLRPSVLVAALFLVPLVAGMSVLAVIAPSAFAESSYPDGRVLIEAEFLLTLAIFAEGGLIGMILSQLHLWANEPAPLFLQIALAVAFLAVCLYPLYDARKSVSSIPVYRQRAAMWDAHAAIIQADVQKGIQDVNIQDGQARSFDPFSGLLDISPDASNWVNQCAAGFFGLHHLTINNQ